MWVIGKHAHLALFAHHVGQVMHIFLFKVFFFFILDHFCHCNERCKVDLRLVSETKNLLFLVAFKEALVKAELFDVDILEH